MAELIKVTDVKVLPDYCLLLTFNTGEVKRFDAKPFLEQGMFKQLKNEKLFALAHVSARTVVWPNPNHELEFDIAPNTLYQCSHAV